MKIALFADSFLPAIGGRELVVHHLALQMQELGHTPVVVGPGGWWSRRHQKYPYPVVRCPSIPGVPFSRVKRSRLLQAHRRYKFDVIHAHATYPSGYIAALAEDTLGVPLVITPHGEDINLVPEIDFGYRLNPELDAKIKTAIQHAARVTAISDTVHDSLVDAGAPEHKIVDIPNGVDTRRFTRPQDESTLKRFGIDADSFVAVSIGNLHPRKGHDVSIRAIKQIAGDLPNVKLVIVGAGTVRLDTLVTEVGLTDQVQLAGTIPTPDPSKPDQPDLLAALLKRANVYISASVGDGAEGLSLALLEAMAASACPLVTEISGNRDVIDNERNGLVVPPGSSEAIAAALRRLYGDRDLCEQLSEAARLDVQASDWLEIAKTYIECYEAVIDNHNCAISRRKV